MSGTNEGLRDWRRVVTGHDPSGKAVVLKYTSNSEPNWSDRSYAERVDEYWHVGRV